MFGLFLNRIVSKKIKVYGLVQGVGFRPFIYRTALLYELTGFVVNTNECVEIAVKGRLRYFKKFLHKIKHEAPKNAVINEIKIEQFKGNTFDDFLILESIDGKNYITEISPDIAVCPQCLDDIKNQKDRINYPFTNCTNCGPRFSIIKALPYDRANTTMDDFDMCSSCAKEYKNPEDRRFHAEPVACDKCGPQYTLLEKKKKLKDINKIIERTVKLLDSGKIISLKGIGGFNLVCDAFDTDAVLRLRELKNRIGKPFVIMFPNIETVKEYLFINKKEEELLLSPARPAVLLKIKKNISIGISNALNTYGVMLPYMLIHYLVFEKLKTKALVYTSGNIADEPIEVANDEALENLKNIYDAILINDRGIYNRADDSVAFVANEKTRIIRRARGYAPAPIQLNINTEGIFAAGAELKNAFCIGKGKSAFLSQHIGDLGEYKNFEFYVEAFERYKKLFKFEPEVVVCDKHPDYLSTRFAKELSGKVISVQHHYAHIASCMAENNIFHDVIGVAFDGTGLGDDGKIWGGEFFVCNLKSYERFIYFDYTALPGGDKAIKEPYRMAVSFLQKTYPDRVQELNLPFFHNIKYEDMALIILSIKNNVNSILTSSVGRLFDAVSALLNLCLISSYEAEAPMLLEASIDPEVDYYYNFSIDKTIVTDEIIMGVVNDIILGIRRSSIAAKFHNTIAQITLEVCKKIKRSHGISRVCLSGGVFQNRYLLERTERLLLKNGFSVYSQTKAPSNDAGISLGQLAVAANLRK